MQAKAPIINITNNITNNIFITNTGVNSNNTITNTITNNGDFTELLNIITNTNTPMAITHVQNGWDWLELINVSAAVVSAIAAAAPIVGAVFLAWFGRKDENVRFFSYFLGTGGFIILFVHNIPVINFIGTGGDASFWEMISAIGTIIGAILVPLALGVWAWYSEKKRDKRNKQRQTRSDKSIANQEHIQIIMDLRRDSANYTHNFDAIKEPTSEQKFAYYSHRHDILKVACRYYNNQIKGNTKSEKFFQIVFDPVIYFYVTEILPNYGKVRDDVKNQDSEKGRT